MGVAPQHCSAELGLGESSPDQWLKGHRYASGSSVSGVQVVFGEGTGRLRASHIESQVFNCPSLGFVRDS